MTDWITAAALGVVEGITEFLPVSSTGHLLIAQHWLRLPANCDADLFTVVIQAPAVLAVIPLFHQRFHQFLFRWSDPAVRTYFLKIVVACVITGGPGFILDKRGLKLPEHLLPVAVALFIGGLLFIIVETWLKKRGREPDSFISWPVVVAIGIGQLIAAVFPGASRSGSTIILALILGAGRPAATEFSFLVSIPTMLAASGLKIFKAFHHSAGQVNEDWTMVIIASIVAAVVSFIVVKWFLHYVQTHTFVAFGVYRIALAGLILAAIFTGTLSDEPTPATIPRGENITMAAPAASRLSESPPICKAVPVRDAFPWSNIGTPTGRA